MIQISLRGKGVFYSEWDLSKKDGFSILDKAAKREEAVEQSWFQLDFFPLKLSGKTIAKPQNEANIKSGLLIDTNSFVEIKATGIKKQKHFIQPLYNEESLFPLFKTSTLKEDDEIKRAEVTVSVFEVAVGLIKHHAIKEEIFNPDLLHFEFKVLPLYCKPILSNVYYKNEALLSVKDDCLITEQQVYFK